MNTAPTTATLDLDGESLRPEELSMPTLMRELNLQQRPNRVLRMIMNALERKRQARGLGWSRSWNKYGLNVFRTHVSQYTADADYFAPLFPVLDCLLLDAPAEFRTFASDLLNDPAILAFTFYHNSESEGAQYEGLTISLGRKVAQEPSHRDRLDLILEDRRVAGRVDGRLDRLRLHVCPWSEYKQDRRHFQVEVGDFEGCDGNAAQALFESCVRHYHAWKNEPERQWSHWSARYIDYFGPRTFIPVGTSFS